MIRKQTSLLSINRNRNLGFHVRVEVGEIGGCRCLFGSQGQIARMLTDKLGRLPTWSEVFTAASEDDRYWDREVRRPAIGFLARGKRDAPVCTTRCGRAKAEEDSGRAQGSSNHQEIASGDDSRGDPSTATQRRKW